MRQHDLSSNYQSIRMIVFAYLRWSAASLLPVLSAPQQHHRTSSSCVLSVERNDDSVFPFSGAAVAAAAAFPVSVPLPSSAVFPLARAARIPAVLPRAHA
ncbi:hypothetical protein GOODEAATRI_009176 [Goodea atripinnis]|uniref:Secreted protein n=1 Tax=Goodea atripinnis TaxID=208336 RepID=A0ABV0NU65_9TELE